MIRRRRPYQNYTTWHNFGSASFWRQMAESPQCAGQLTAQHVGYAMVQCYDRVR